MCNSGERIDKNSKRTKSHFDVKEKMSGRYLHYLLAIALS